VNAGILNYGEVASLVKEAAVKVAKSVAKTEMNPEEFSESFCACAKRCRKLGKFPCPECGVEKSSVLLVFVGAKFGDEFFRSVHADFPLLNHPFSHRVHQLSSGACCHGYVSCVERHVTALNALVS
jgi:hypothetical protein